MLKEPWAQVLRLLGQLLHELINVFILLPPELVELAHGLQTIEVESLGHEHILAVAPECVLDLEELGPPLLVVVVVPDLEHFLGQVGALLVLEHFVRSRQDKELVGLWSKLLI